MLVGAILTMALNPLLRLIIGRSVGPSGYGLIALGFSVLTIASSFSVLGFDAALARFIPFYQGRREPERIPSTILFCAVMVACCSTSAAAVLYSLSGRLAQTLGHDPDFGRLLKVFAFALPLMALTQLFVASLRGFRRIRSIVLVNNGFGDGLRLLLLLFLASRGLSILQVAVIYLVTYLCTFSVSLLLLLRVVSEDRSGEQHMVAPDIRQLFAFSSPLLLSQGLGQLVRQADLLILGYFLTAGQTGIYAAALLVPRLLSTAINALNVVFPPYLSYLFSEGKLSSLKDVYQTVVRWAFYATFPALIVVCVLAKEILRTAFGASYEGGATVLVILTVGVVLATVPASLQDETLMAVGRTRINLLASLLALICVVVCGVLLVPRLGLVGGALANVAGGGAFFITEFIPLYATFRLRPFGVEHLKFLMASGAGSVLLLGLASLPVTSIYKLAVAFPLVYATGFLGLLVLNGVHETEFGLLRAMGRRLARPSLQDG